MFCWVFICFFNMWIYKCIYYYFIEVLVFYYNRNIENRLWGKKYIF